MIAVAPRSANISAERSPVWAPDALAWQSCAPIAIVEPAAFTKVPSNVAGGQFGGFDYDSGTRIAESYAKAGKLLAAFLEKQLK